jgi:predicted RNA binding protein YcfA (HicA-like mRNA interferase family)
MADVRVAGNPAKEIKKGTLQSILRDPGLNM